MPFWPPDLTNQKIKILKLKKTLGDITILHICTLNDNHMMYGSWDVEWDRQNFLSFWNAFHPFNPLWAQKIKILKKRKKNACRYHFTQVYQKWQSYDVWFLTYEVWLTKFFVTLDQFFPFPPITTQINQNFEKLKETPGRDYSRHLCLPPFLLRRSALAIRKKVQQQLFAVDICQFEGISTAKI